LAGIATAKEMWDILKQRLDTTASVKGRLALRKQFREARPLSGRPLSEFISLLHSLRYQLSNSPQSIDDETFKDQLLTSLPSSYSNLVEIIHEREGDISIDDIIRKIQQLELIRSRQAISGNTSMVSGEALYSQQTHRSWKGNSQYRKSPYPQVGRYNQTFPGRCNKCQAIGHKAVDCQSPSQRIIVCFACGESGHGTKTCPHKVLSQDQASKGRASLLRWKDERTGNSNKALIAQGSSSASLNHEGTCAPL
jgi:hypothetical protein